MTAAAVPADIVPPRPAWHALLWIVPLRSCGIVLIYWQPIIPASGVPTTAHQLTAHGVYRGSVCGSASKATDLTPGQRRATWLVMIPYTLWFAVAWSAAINGAFARAPHPSPVPLLTVGDLPAVVIGGAAAVAVVEAGGAGARCDARDLARRASALPRNSGTRFSLLCVWLRGCMPGVFCVAGGMAMC